MANVVTLYNSNISGGVNIHALCGDLERVSMWTTVTNVLRMANLVLMCYCSPDELYYMTADGKLYRVKE